MIESQQMQTAVHGQMADMVCQPFLLMPAFPLNGAKGKNEVAYMNWVTVGHKLYVSFTLGCGK